MSVPKAAVKENHRVVAWKNNIRRSKIAAVVFPEAETSPEKRTPQSQLDFCVLAVNFRHIQTSLLGGQFIHKKDSRRIKVQNSIERFFDFSLNTSSANLISTSFP